MASVAISNNVEITGTVDTVVTNPINAVVTNQVETEVTNIVDTNITNTSLSVNVNNTEVDVNVTNTTFDVNITNASVPVTGTVDTRVLNPISVTGSSVTASITSPVGAQPPTSAVAVANAISSTFSTGQKAVTNSALALGSSTTYRNGFALTNLSTSTASVFIGTASVTTSTGFELAIGASIVIPVQDIATIYVIAASAGTSTVSWIGFN